MRLLTCIITCLLLLVSCDKEVPEPEPTFKYDIMDSSNLFGYNVDILKGTATVVRVSLKTRFPNKVVVPDAISKNGKKFLVTEIGWAVFKDAANIQQVILPKNLETIGVEAFMNCTSLKTIKLPENLQRISSYAFKNAGLTTLTIPKSVKKLNEYSFGGCKDLKTVNFEESDTPLEYVGSCRLNYFRDCSIESFFLGRSSLQEFDFPAIKHLVIGNLVKEIEACNLDRVQNTIVVENPCTTKIEGLCKTSTYLNVRLLVPKIYLENVIPAYWKHFAQIQGY